MPLKVTGPKGGLIYRHATVDKVAAKLAWLIRRFRRVTIAEVPSEFTMYDSVNLDAIPVKAQAVAGYVNGRWPTYGQLRERWPQAKRLSITVTADALAECLDIEKGDATPDQASVWVRRQHGRGVKRPVVYTSVSQAPTVLNALKQAGIGRLHVRLWTAHYTGKPHRCTSACGYPFPGRADATQYTDRAFGRTLDASLCAPDFF